MCMFIILFARTPKLEKAFNDCIYVKPNFDTKDGILMTNISDVRQVRTLNNTNDYCVVCTNGLMGQPYDMLEHRQDSV